MFDAVKTQNVGLDNVPESIKVNTGEFHKFSYYYGEVIATTLIKTAVVLQPLYTTTYAYPF